MKLRHLLPALTAAASMFGANATPKAPALVSCVEPPYWWVGMANDTLQIMLSGPDIARADISLLPYPGVALAESVTLQSPNYRLLYLCIAPHAKPGTLKFHISLGSRRTILDYKLLPRDRAPEDYSGFDASDVLYLLMPDRFAKGDDIHASRLRNPSPIDRSNPNARHGGDLKGIADHLDYLDSLGITAIWLCPVLENDMPGGSYHGYATTDYYRVDPRFGSNDDYRNLIVQAHKRGIKVVMDMIFNHAGIGHPWLKDLPAPDWLNHPDGAILTNFRLSTLHDPYVSSYDLDHTVNGWFVPDMPDLNQRNPHLRRYLSQNSIWWIESAKINGIRMDTYPYADSDAMAQWVADVMREYPNFNIVGECWYGNEAGSAFWQKGNHLNPKETNLPTVMDFRLAIDGHKMFDAETTPWDGLNHLYDHLAMDYLFPDPQRVLTFLDNHDTDRFLLNEPSDLDSWKQAITFLLTSRGIPQLYYGTELLMNGSKEGSDGFVRRDFPGGFPTDSINAFSPDSRTPLQNEAWNFLSSLLQWRRSPSVNPVIARGSLKHFMPQNGAYVYERRLADRQIVVILNGTSSPLTLDMARYAEILPLGTSYTDLLSSDKITITPTLTLSPRQTLILSNF